MSTALVCWEGRSAAGLALPADIPSLDPRAAIDRHWHIPEGSTLLQPDPPPYIPTGILYGYGYSPFGSWMDLAAE